MGVAMAQDKPIVLFPKGAPGEKVQLVEEIDHSEKVGGEPIIRLKNVSEPTITIYHAPEELASGAAMVVCPGGGYNILAMDLEGTEIIEKQR